MLPPQEGPLLDLQSVPAPARVRWPDGHDPAVASTGISVPSLHYMPRSAIPAQGHSPKRDKADTTPEPASEHASGYSDFVGWGPGGLQVGAGAPLSPHCCCGPPVPIPTLPGTPSLSLCLTRLSQTPPCTPWSTLGMSREEEKGVVVQPTLGTRPPAAGAVPSSLAVPIGDCEAARDKWWHSRPFCRLPDVGAALPQLLVLHGNPTDQDGGKHGRGSLINETASQAQIDPNLEEGEESAFDSWGAGGRRGGPSQRANPYHGFAVRAWLPDYLHSEYGSPWSLLSPALPKACYKSRKSVKI